MENYRHGDLVFSPTNEIPKDGKLRPEAAEYPLAFGEVTGHSHRLKGKAKVYDLPNDELILAVEEDSELSHEEHKTIRFPKGLYLMRKEQEFNYFDNEIARVAD